MSEEIQELFAVRTAAVQETDREAFRSTQLFEIDLSSIDEYLSLQNLAIEVLHIHRETDFESVALVRETYTWREKPQRSTLLLYYLTRTVPGWRIFRIR
ncbi:hypothetical protein [Streptomyces sp. NPDC005533]|uniref:hypothetical protein n=1 Tax=Streptomyces sp. NPDC005533 TaxID=3364723 RepID=UPI00368873CA